MARLPQPALFHEDQQPDVPGMLHADAGTQVVVKSHTRHIRRHIEDRNAGRKKRQKPKETLQQRFMRYHDTNPEVFRRLVAMAVELKGKGVQHYGIAALWEVLRYQAITARDTDGMPFKLSNNHRAYYARLIHDQVPELAGFFRVRALR